MAIVDTSRRLPTRSILQDIEAYEALALRAIADKS